MRPSRCALALVASSLVVFACSSSEKKPASGPYRLTVEAVPAEGGKVTLDPVQPQDGYAAGTVVQLKASYHGGWSFTGWEGDLSGTDLKATLTMEAPKTVRAVFAVAVIDNTAPRLASMSPANQATCVKTDRALTLVFSEPMKMQATQAAVALSPSVDGAFSWNAEGTQLTFTPSSPWAASQRYDVTVGAGAQDLAGNPVDGGPLALAFFTAGGTNSPGSFECFASWLAGAFTNDRQYKAALEDPSQGSVKNIRLRMRRCWSDRADEPGYWLYVEQAVAFGSGPNDAFAPYRQRVYHLVHNAQGDFESHIFSLKDRPTEMLPADFQAQILDKVGDAGDKAFLQTAYENDGDKVRLVGMSRHYYAALKIIIAVLQQYEGTSNPAVPTRLHPEELQSRVLAHIDDALLQGLDDATYHLGSLSAAEGQALVSGMYATDPVIAELLLIRPKFEENDPQRLRTILNGIGYNGGHNHDPQDFAGDWQKPNPLATLGPDDVEEKAGCAVTLRWDGSSAYVGGTAPKACANTYGGAVYANSEVMLREASMVSWDRGFDANDNQVWGGDERYEFDKALELPLD